MSQSPRVQAGQRRAEQQNETGVTVHYGHRRERGIGRLLAQRLTRTRLGIRALLHAQLHRRIGVHYLYRTAQAFQAQVAGAQHFVASRQRIEQLPQAWLIERPGEADAGAGNQGAPEKFLAGEHGTLLGGKGESVLMGGQLHGKEPQSSARSALFWAIAIAVRILRGPVKALRAWRERMLSSSTTSPFCQGNSTITPR
ncbi:hypothetical protein D3C85_882030 [compost metagenome]